MTRDRAASSARRLMLLGAVGVAFSACGRAGPPPVTYVLGTPSPAAETAVPLIGRPVIMVQRVPMPDYLDVTDIQIRRPGNVMAPSATGRWGERLSAGFRRALTDDLARHLSGFTVTTQQPTDTPFRQVLTDVEAFEPRPDGQIVLSARWRVTDGNGNRQLAGESVSLTEQAADASDAAVVAAMSRAIERLSVRIAMSIQRGATECWVARTLDVSYQRALILTHRRDQTVMVAEWQQSTSCGTGRGGRRYGGHKQAVGKLQNLSGQVGWNSPTMIGCQP